MIPPETYRDKNKEYEKPCPYNSLVQCVQHPSDNDYDGFCEECEVKLKGKT